MKNKLILPLLAVLIAVTGAIAAPLLVQTGWYDSDGAGPNSPVSANITTPAGDTPVCGTSGNRICLIGAYDAYSTALGASTMDNTKLLRYTQP